MNNPADHPTRQDLTEFALGQLFEDEIGPISSHLNDCESCCEKLETIPGDRFTQLAQKAGKRIAQTSEHSSQYTSRKQTSPIGLEALSRYRVLERIGGGGMGDVYRAEHKMMGREVALKVINKELVKHPASISRFRNEVRAAAKLSHPNIVSSYDAENVGDLHFLVMELVQGESLAERVNRDGPTPERTAINLVRQVANGLKAAFEAGMVHRDIKPQNLMLDESGVVKILDFGLARFEREQQIVSQGNQPTNAGLTGTHFAIGTPDYIAPEQAKDSTAADVRSDIYSLGCTLYFLLSGQVPFPAGDPLEKISQHLVAHPTDIRELNPNVTAETANLIGKMMAKLPEQRFQSPDELLLDLAKLESHLANSHLTPVDTTQRSERSLSRRVGSPNLSKAQKIYRRTFLFLPLVVLGAFGLAAMLSNSDGELRVLFVCPNQLYYPDLFRAKDYFVANGVEVTIAAPDFRIEPVAAEQGAAFDADILLDMADGREFDAIIFVGGHLNQLTEDPSNMQIIRQLAKSVESENGIIGGICVGVNVVNELAPMGTRISNYKNPVTVDLPFVTIPDPDLAEEFVKTVIDEFSKKRKGLAVSK